MADPEKKIWITYNGEVYNFRELREELARLGFSFRSSSDTEVIINSYKAWGIKCILKFNGMFAFALWDSERKRLFLVRDRYGIKPLYYSLENGTLLFASEIKAILEHEEVARELWMTRLFASILRFRTFFQTRRCSKGFISSPQGTSCPCNVIGSFTAQGWDHERSTSSERLESR